MANLPTDDSARGASLLRQQVPLFRALGTLDDAVYVVERIVVVASLIIMTVASFMKVLSDFLAKVDIGVTVYLITALVVFAIARVATAAAPTLKAHSTKATLYAFAVTAFSVAYIAIIHTQESSVVLATTGVGAALALLAVNFRGVGATLPWSLARIVSVGASLVICIAVVGIAMGFDKGLGYSWAPNISLTLLLWMAFLGASMATHDKRHLGIDAIRKAVPAKYARLYTALSFVVSGAVTLAFFYLSWTYLEKRIHEAPEPGKIPDWIKVLSIPVSLGLMSARFIGYSIAEFFGWVKGIPPEAPPASTDETIDADANAPEASV